MATWIVPKVEGRDRETLEPDLTQTGDLVFDTTLEQLFISIVDPNDPSAFVYSLVGGGLTLTGDENENAVVVTNSSGTAESVQLGPSQFLRRNAADDGWDAVDVSEITSAITNLPLASLESGQAHEFLTTDSSGSVEFSAPVGAGQLVGRSTGGALQGQKLHPSMVDENSIPYSRLTFLQPGQILGVPASDNVNQPAEAVSAIDISSIAGSSITSSVTAPADPNENDLWYYCGEQAGDNARLYIYQNGVWIDAAPPIVVTDPGIDGERGPQGEQGDTGRSVQAIVLQDRQGADDIVLEFYDDLNARQASNLIDDVTIPIDDIRAESDLPVAPDGTVDAIDYALRVQSGAPPRWTEVEGGAVVKRLYKHTIGGSDGDMIEITASTLGRTDLPNNFIITYNGFSFEEGSSNDYTYSTNNNGTIVITVDTADALRTEAARTGNSNQIEISVYESA